MDSDVYAGNALIDSVKISDEDAARYQSLLASYDECLEREAQERARMAKLREDNVKHLTKEYGLLLSIDLNTAYGRKWFEKTVKFYSASDILSERFEAIVARSRVIMESEDHP
ncbi:MAG: hypothetical protein ACOX2O_06375 [Bdellovibrionota bacterium]